MRLLFINLVSVLKSHLFKVKSFVKLLQQNYNKIIKKGYIFLRWISFFQVVYWRINQSEGLYEIRFYFFLKRRFFRTMVSYYEGLEDYYSDRVYEDGSEHKFNERIWYSDLNNIKNAINSYLYREFIAFLKNPLQYVRASFIFISFLDNLKFWFYIIPFFIYEVFIIFLEVFYSFYTNHNEDMFCDIFLWTKPSVSVKVEDVPLKKMYADFIIDLPQGVVDDKKSLDKKES